MILQSYVKREHCVQKRLAFLRAMPSESNFDEVRVTAKNECNVCKRACFLRAMPSESNFAELAPTILKSFFQKKNVSLSFFILLILIFAADVSPGEGGTSYIVGKLLERRYVYSCNLKPEKFHSNTRWHRVFSMRKCGLASLYLCCKGFLRTSS